MQQIDYRAMALVDAPLALSILAFAAMWSAAHVGIYLRRLKRDSQADEQVQFGVIVGAGLTLLGLLIGFSYSMAVSRYDHRKSLEEEEANAIGTAYLRAGLLPAAEAARVRGQLETYLDERVLFYTTRDEQRVEQINASCAAISADLWSIVQGAALAQPGANTALATAGMNSVLNSQGYTQAAWWNRIPIAAWGLMLIIGACCNVLLGYSTPHPEIKVHSVYFILPGLIAVSFFLIAELDSPRDGLIRVRPLNLLSLSHSWPSSRP
jgi:hypothetical protein